MVKGNQQTKYGVKDKWRKVAGRVVGQPCMAGWCKKAKRCAGLEAEPSSPLFSRIFLFNRSDRSLVRLDS